MPNEIGAALARLAAEFGADNASRWLDNDRRDGRVFLVENGALLSLDAAALNARYERVPAGDALLGTPEGNAAVVAKLTEMAESVGVVFVPDPDKLARCGGVTAGDAREALAPESDAEWELEQRAFHAANRRDVPEDVRQTVKDLWREVVAREPAALSEGGGDG